MSYYGGVSYRKGSDKTVQPSWPLPTIPTEPQPYGWKRRVDWPPRPESEPVRGEPWPWVKELLDFLRYWNREFAEPRQLIKVDIRLGPGAEDFLRTTGVWQAQLAEMLARERAWYQKAWENTYLRSLYQDQLWKWERLTEPRLNPLAPDWPDLYQIWVKAFTQFLRELDRLWNEAFKAFMIRAEYLYLQYPLFLGAVPMVAPILTQAESVMRSMSSSADAVLGRSLSAQIFQFADYFVPAAKVTAGVLLRTHPVIRTGLLLWGAYDILRGLQPYKYLDRSGYYQICGFGGSYSTDMPAGCVIFNVANDLGGAPWGHPSFNPYSKYLLNPGAPYLMIGGSEFADMLGVMGRIAGNTNSSVGTGLAPAPVPAGHPATYIQTIDPFLLPIGQPVPIQQPLPYRDIPNRPQENPERAPGEQSERGPQFERGPQSRRGVGRSQPAQGIRPDSAPRIEPGLGQPLPLLDLPVVFPLGEDALPFPWEYGRFGEAGATITATAQGTSVSAPVDLPPHGDLRDREKKKKVLVNVGPVRIVGAFTEFLDTIGDVWEAIPKEFRTKPPQRKVKGDDGRWRTVGVYNKAGRLVNHPPPEIMLVDIWQNWGKLDIAQAVKNIIMSNAKDALIGRVNRKASTEFARRTGRRFGPSTGPAL